MKKTILSNLKNLMREANRGPSDRSASSIQRILAPLNKKEEEEEIALEKREKGAPSQVSNPKSSQHLSS
jgi:hypothetical protein